MIVTLLVAICHHYNPLFGSREKEWRENRGEENREKMESFIVWIEKKKGEKIKLSVRPT